MNLRGTLYIAPQVQDALRASRPVVALPSALFAGAMPLPDAPAFAQALSDSVREAGAVPALIGIVDGVLKAGLSPEECRRLCAQQGVLRASRRDVPLLAAHGGTGAATVAAAMIIASLAGIRTLAAAGIGGVSLDAAQTFDISADLQELRKSSQLVVCAGVNAPAAPAQTLEYLETMGVPVLGLHTPTFTGLYGSGAAGPIPSLDEEGAARTARIKWDLGLTGGVLAVCPAPTVPGAEKLEELFAASLAEARRARVRAGALTPWVLGHLPQELCGELIRAHWQLTLRNAQSAAHIAAVLARR